MNFIKTTEMNSQYSDLENKSINEIVFDLNKEDQSVAVSVSKALPSIERLIEAVVPQLENGGRLFYIGAGTSGRLGILDASECPPTFGVPDDLVIGLIAGGDNAIRKAVENAEDSTTQSWKDLEVYSISSKDMLIGIAASGSTPYVVAAIEKANEKGIPTGCITMNSGSPLALVAKYPVVVTVGPEYVTGSSRMKAGTAQKMVLNMITTTSMIKLGRVKGNKMVDMQLTNDKLVNRGIKMIMDETKVDYQTAEILLKQQGSVRKAVESFFEKK